MSTPHEQQQALKQAAADFDAIVDALDGLQGMIGGRLNEPDDPEDDWVVYAITRATNARAAIHEALKPRQLPAATRPYTVVGLYLDHPSAVGETFVRRVEAEAPGLATIDEDDRPFAVLAVFEGHLDPAYEERLV